MTWFTIFFPTWICSLYHTFDCSKKLNFQKLAHVLHTANWFVLHYYYFINVSIHRKWISYYSIKFDTIFWRLLNVEIAKNKMKRKKRPFVAFSTIHICQFKHIINRELQFSPPRSNQSRYLFLFSGKVNCYFSFCKGCRTKENCAHEMGSLCVTQEQKW